MSIQPADAPAPKKNTEAQLQDAQAANANAANSLLTSINMLLVTPQAKMQVKVEQPRLVQPGGENAM